MTTPSSSTTTFLYGGHVHANGIRQHYLRYGGERANQTPVILIPGITSPAITWGFVAEQLGKFLDVYVLDVRGRGLSDACDNLDYSLDAQAQDVIALTHALGLQGCSLLGHSMGARIAMRAAHQAPDLFSRAVLVDPPVSGPGRRPYPANLPWYIDSMALARQGTDAKGMLAYCPTWTEEQRQLRAEWLHTCNEGAIRTSFDGFHTDDVHQDLAKLTLPLHLVTAARGDVVLDSDVQELVRLAPQLTHHRVPDAGHMIPWDNESGFYAALGTTLGPSLI
jgi:N-formylmaleamate deformylase